jgi:hypothetical protein
MDFRDVPAENVFFLSFPEVKIIVLGKNDAM